jgi:hypothetical protein
MIILILSVVFLNVFESFSSIYFEPKIR